MRLRRTALVLAAGLSGLALSTAAQAATVGSATDFVTPASATQSVKFNVYMPLQNQAALSALMADLNNPKSANYQKWLTPDQFNARFGPSSTSIANVTKALSAQGLAVTSRNGLALEVSGTASAVSHTFSTSLSNVQPRVGLAHMVANTPLQLPAALQAEGVKILAFSGRPPMQTHIQRSTGKFSPQNRYGPAGPYWFTDLKQAYSYPSYQSLDGTGVGVAIVIPSAVLASDISAVFNHEQFTTITGKPVPTVANVPLTVDGNPPAPFSTSSDASFEASLDVQEVLGGAPGASVSMIDIPDLSDDSILAAYNYVVQQGGSKFQLVNSSFGECELFYTSPAYGGGTLPGFDGVLSGDDVVAEYENVFIQGNAEGITFVASSGDSAGLQCPDPNYIAPYLGKTPTAPPRFLPGVSFPATSPFVTAVGGTNVVTAVTPGSKDSAYVSENGLGDPELPYDPYGLGLSVSGGYWGSGGGVSTYFTKSLDAAAVNTGSSFRTTPDIGMQVGGCPGGISITPCGPNRSAVLIAFGFDPVSNPYYDGVIGTSVSSPELVGALALYVQKLGHGVGDVNGFLYTKGAAQTAGTSVSYHRNITGFDGKYSGSYPSANYNYITGNGTPIVRQLFDMTGLPPAGPPQTPSNP